MPVNGGVERHLVMDDDLNIVIFVAQNRGPRKLAIDLDHLPLLAIGRPGLPRDDPVPLEKRPGYAC